MRYFNNHNLVCISPPAIKYAFTGPDRKMFSQVFLIGGNKGEKGVFINNVLL